MTATTASELVKWMRTIDPWQPIFGERIHYNRVPQYDNATPTCPGIREPYVWFSLDDASNEPDICLEGREQPLAYDSPYLEKERQSYTVELYTLTPEDAQLAKAALQAWHTYYGWIGNANASLYVKSLMVDNVGDDYLYRGIGASDAKRGGFEVVAQVLEVIPRLESLATIP